MKTRKTRLICLLLSLVLVVGMMPTAYAAEATETIQQTAATVTTEPTQEATAPTGETTAPTEETTAPTEETTAPTEETTAPTEETTAPTEETTAPTEETTVPTEETTVPTEETTVPTEEVMVPTEEVMVPTETTEGQAVESYAVETLQQDASGLPKLSTPTDLTWGVYCNGWNADGEVQSFIEGPGTFSWKAGELHQGEFSVEVYRQNSGGDESVYEMLIDYGTNNTEWYSSYGFLASTPESGTYYFTITAVGDGVNYANSDTATSDLWTYTKPQAKLESCTNLTWSWPWMQWINPDATDVSGSEVEILFSPSAVDEPYWVGATSAWGAGGSWVGGTDQSEVYDDAIQSNGVGYYYFRVRVLSRDITKICNSDWSELSPAYNLTSVSEDVNTELDNILNGSGSNEEKIQAVQAMDSTELKTAMLADEKTVEKIQQLENTAAGGPADVVVSDQIPEINGSQVNVTGANLNMRENTDESVSLVIDKPEQEHILPTQFSNALSVKFSMTLENVPDPDNLQVPVLISLPVPQNINPDFLVILHYRVDGSFELVWPNIVQTGSGTFAEFAVTRFSDFVMTQLAGEPESTQPMYRLYNPYTLEHLFTTGEGEKESLAAIGWIYEGVAWNAPTTGTPIYRLYNPYSDGHFYTASEAEVQSLLPLGWQMDGVVTYSAGSSGTPIYRLFNPYETKNYHHYTTSQEEIDMLVNLGWILEGVAWYAA